MNIKAIAEIGINHNGDIEIAKKLINNAKETGFDLVKFQKRTIDLVYSKEILESYRESPWGKTQRKQKEGLEFTKKDYDIIDDYCKKLNIGWFASAWDIESQKFLRQYELEYNKVASAMITDRSLLEFIAEERKHTFISTGMSSIEQIDNAVKIFKDKNCSFELMHCISTYPMPPEQANLKTISFLRDKYNCNIGYSGHETGVAVSVAAAAMGITSIERHITLDRSMYGSDQSASLEKRGMYELIGSIRIVEKALGENKLGYVFDEELEIAKKLRAHIKN